MGLLSSGEPLIWEECKKYSKHIQRCGIKQFIHQYNKLKHRRNDKMYWGDEIEYMIVRFDNKNRKAQLSLKSPEIIKYFGNIEQKCAAKGETAEIILRPEYAQYMIESIPRIPYKPCIKEVARIENGLKMRRQKINEKFDDPNEELMLLTAFPMLGAPEFTYPEYKISPETNIVSNSLYFPDEAIFSGHSRFKSLTRNIRQRRHKKVAINIPIYQDKFTKDPYEDVHMKPLGAIPNHIHMDASGFGMGCCCLQMTFQARCIEEARHIYDQLAAFTPIILALSSASPVYKSYLSNIDCRWNVIAASMDDRTDEELGLSPLKNDEYKIPKSRYGSITSYLTEKGRKFNDVKIVKNEEYYQNLLDNGVDDLLAQHIAHLFIRDPISCYREKLNIDNENDTDHFENIQSTNWQSLRFKLPPPNSPIGWRVEFRTPDLQFTDFENAAFITFVSLMTRVIIYNTKLNFIIPISKLDQNIQRAHTPNAVVDEKFYFNKNYDKVGAPENIVEMTINEIMNGCENFRGMINLMYVHINKGCINDKLRHILAGYMQLIQKRSNGELVTNATWIRNFITSHPEYQQDSKITHSINYDLLSTIRKISNLEIFDCKLLPCIYICDQQLVKSKNYNRDKQEEIIAKNKKCVEIAIKYKRLIYSSTEKIDKCNWEIFHDEHCECRSVVDC